MISGEDKKEPSGGQKPFFRHGPQKPVVSHVVSRQPKFEAHVVSRLPKFEGRCEQLKGHVFDCSDARQSDMYTKTIKEIAEYVGRTYKYSGDIRLAVENLELPDTTEPDDPPANATRTQVRIWEKQVDEYVKRDNYLKENIKTL